MPSLLTRCELLSTACIALSLICVHTIIILHMYTQKYRHTPTHRHKPLTNASSSPTLCSRGRKGLSDDDSGCCCCSFVGRCKDTILVSWWTNNGRRFESCHVNVTHQIMTHQWHLPVWDPSQLAAPQSHQDQLHHVVELMPTQVCSQQCIQIRWEHTHF